MRVYLLHHEREVDGIDDVKLVGVYGSEQEAEAAKARAGRLSGFKEHPEGFSIGEHEVGRDQWTSGFVTVNWASEEREANSGKAA